MTIPAIAALPTAPARTDAPATFVARADAFVAALPTLRTQINTTTTAIDGVASTVGGNATTAAADAATASAAATAADATANAVLWVSAGSYTAGQNRYSPINYLTYRAITTHSGETTDPSLDETNWTAVLPSSFALGDTLTTAVALSSPEWLPSDGAVYLQSSYPDLFGLLGLLKFDPPEKLTNPAALPTGTGEGTAFSTDGTYLSVVHATSPFVTIYKETTYESSTQFQVTTSPDVLHPLKSFIKAT